MKYRGGIIPTFYVVKFFFLLASMMSLLFIYFLIMRISNTVINNSIDATFPCLDTFSHNHQQPGMMIHDWMCAFCVCVCMFMYMCTCVYMYVGVLAL